MKKRMSIKLLSLTLAVSSVISLGLFTAKPTILADEDENVSTEAVITNPKIKLVTDIAISERGYYEKKSSKNLYNKKANKWTKGKKKNYTKYAYEFDHYFTNFYKGKKQTAGWCDMFVDWCFVTAFGEKGARAALYQPSKSYGAGANSSMNYYKKKDGKKDKNGKKINSFSKTPKIGDQVFFGKSSKSTKATHTGLVIDVNKDSITIIEGNAGKKENVVARSVIYKNKPRYKKIIGFGHPDYSAVSTSKTLSFVNKLYSKAIDTGLVAWKKFLYSNKLACGKTKGADLVKAVFKTNRMNELTPTDEEYIQKITSILFDREPTEEELQQWLGALESGEATRPDVLKAFVNTDEFVTMCKQYSIKKAGTIA